MDIIFYRIEKLNRFFKMLGVFTGGIAAVLMMLIIVADVFLRNVFNSPISGTYEIVQYYLMPLAIFPAIAYTYSSGILPRISELIEKAPKRFNILTTVIIIIIEFIIFSLLAIYGWKFAMSGVSDRMAIPVGGSLFPLYPIYFLIPIGFGLVVLEILLSAIKPIVSRRKTDNDIQ